MEGRREEYVIEGQAKWKMVRYTMENGKVKANMKSENINRGKQVAERLGKGKG